MKAMLHAATVRNLPGILRELLEPTVMKQKIPEQQVFVPKQLFAIHAENTIMRNGYRERLHLSPLGSFCRTLIHFTSGKMS